MRQLRDYLPPILLSKPNSNFIESFLLIFQKIMLSDNGDPRRIPGPRGTKLVRAIAPVDSANGNLVFLTSQAKGPIAFRPGDKVQVLETGGASSHSSTIVQISWSPSPASQYELLLSDPVASPIGSGTIRIADVESGDRRFRIESEHRISRGNRLLISQGETSAEATVIDVDGDFIHFARGVSNTTGVFSQDLAAPPILACALYEPLEKTIDELDRLFDPWRSSPDLLSWLGAVLGLEMEAHWGEYQRRFLVSHISELYHRFGTKEVLLKLLDIYTTQRDRLRICFDDGESLFRLRSLDESNATLELLAQASYYSADASSPKMSLLHPTSIVETKTHGFFVSDAGGADSRSPGVNLPAIWKIFPSGNIDGNPLTDDKLLRPISLALDSSDRLLILDGGIPSSPSRLYRWDGATLETAIAPLPANVKPLSLCYFPHPDDGGDCFAILAVAYTGPANPTIYIYRDNSGTIELTTHDLSGPIAMPVCFLKIRDSEFEFFVADGMNDGSKEPANLFHVKLKKGSDGLEKPSMPLLDPALLADANTLVWPSGITYGTSNSLLVCDTGLRHGRTGMADRAEPPAVYRIHLPSVAGGYGELQRIDVERKLTNPSAIIKAEDDTVYLLDRGEFHLMGSGHAPLEYRAKSHEVSVVEYFSKDVNDDDQRRTRAQIRRLLERFGPAHVTIHIKGVFAS